MRRGSRVLDASIAVTTASSSTSLVELDALKTELGISGSSFDTALQLLIDAVSLQLCAERGLGRAAWRQDYKVRLQGEGGRYLEMPVYPIISIASVYRLEEVAANLVDASSYERASIDRVRFLPDRIYKTDGDWQEHAFDVDYIVNLTAGWNLPGDSASGDQIDLPEDINRAALLSCVQGWKTRKVVQAIASGSFEGLAVRFRSQAEVAEFIPEQAFAVMRSYR